MKQIKNQSGFTIVEIVTGIIVMTIFVGGIGITVNNLTYINDRSYDQVLLNGLVENKAESLRSASFNALENGTFDFSDELPSSIGTPKSATYTVEDNPDTETANTLKDVTFTITYTVGRSSETVNYTTSIGELGVAQ